MSAVQFMASKHQSEMVTTVNGMHEEFSKNWRENHVSLLIIRFGTKNPNFAIRNLNLVYLIKSV